jgi:hypothetical protein
MFAMSAAFEQRHDPEQIRELELLRREYEAQMLVSCDPSEKRRLYSVMKQLDACIENMKARLAV